MKLPRRNSRALQALLLAAICVALCFEISVAAKARIPPKLAASLILRAASYDRNFAQRLKGGAVRVLGVEVGSTARTKKAAGASHSRRVARAR